MTDAIEHDTTGALELLERAVAQASAVLACVPLISASPSLGPS